ncbi:MAG: peptidyl-prolyl cis-trans isomerase [Phycisphaerales bacterium]
MTQRIPLCLLAGTLLIGCETAPQPAASSSQPAPTGLAQQTGQPNTARPVAYINGTTVTDRDLQGPLIEAAGGSVLSEITLDRLIRDQLDQRGLTLTPALIEQEKANMLATLSADPNEAVRLLNEMRARRGLGEIRFQSMLFRNAGLRLLVQDQVEVAPALVFQAYELQYGKRYRVRILVAETMAKASELLIRAKAGESFSDLAAKNSTDVSAAQGGLLSPISPADATYPKTLRQSLEGMQIGGISDLLAVDDRFIIMKLEEILSPDPISFVDARPQLERTVRLETEAQLMQQTARAMLADAKVVVLDPALNKSWNAQQ